MSSEESCCKETGAGIGVAIELPLSIKLSPIVITLLTQLAQYAVSHADQIVEALIKLLDGKAALTAYAACEAFKIDPTEVTFSDMVGSFLSNGIEADKISATLLNEVMVPTPA